MEIKVKAMATLKFKPWEKLLKEEIKNMLTITNPKFVMAQQMGKSQWGIDQFYTYYQNCEEGLDVPAGALKDILGLAGAFKPDLNGKSSLPKDLKDARVSPSDEYYFKNLQFKGSLRSYQKNLVNATNGKTVGVLQADTGAGKTVCFVYLTVERGVNTLVVVDRKELANQAIAEFTSFTDLAAEDIGFIGDGKFEVKPVTVALHQTLNKLDEEDWAKIEDYFGMVISDEAHTIAAETYYNNLTKFSAKYKWGFTATPEREDGLTNVIFWATGPLIYQLTEEDKREIDEHLIRPSYIPVSTNYHFPLYDTTDFQLMINDLSEDEERNEFILDTAEKYKEQPSVYLCLRVGHIITLTEQLQKRGHNVTCLHSKLKKSEREERMAKLISGEIQDVVSSWGLFSTGINVKRLEVLFICAPMKSKTKVKQAAGRIMRTAKGKTSSIIIDFVDTNVWLLSKQAQRRDEIIKTVSIESTKDA